MVDRHKPTGNTDVPSMIVWSFPRGTPKAVINDAWNAVQALRELIVSTDTEVRLLDH